MELTITSMTPADRLYAYNQSSQLEGQTGCIGHLRGDFGSGQEEQAVRINAVSL